MRQIWFINSLVLAVSITVWAAEPQKKTITDTVVKGYQNLSERAFGSVMQDQIKETEKLAEPPEKVARNIKGKLDLYKDAVPLRIVANDICSAQGAKMNAYYKDEVFSFQESLDPAEKNRHTTLIRHKQFAAKEHEKFVQIQSYRRSEYGTYTYALINGSQVTPLTDVKTAIRMIDQFVSGQVLPALRQKSSIDQKEHARLKLELHDAWNLFKEVGACCAASTCKKSLTTQMTPIGSSGQPRLSPASGSSGAH